MAAFPVEPAPETTPALVSTAVEPDVEPELAAGRDRHLVQTLLPGLLLLLLLPLGTGFLALKELLGLPDMPRCWAIARAEESTSNQIYCAEILANKATANDLSRAIELVAPIRSSDPLSAKAEHLIQKWTKAILSLANAEYQAGSLSKAQDIAQQVPANAFTSTFVEEQIKRWETEWSKAEDLYAQTQTNINDARWYDALTTARKLLQIDNQYWAIQKYQELMRILQSARENHKPTKKANTQTQPATVDDLITRWEKEQQQSDVAHIQKANALAKTGGLDSLRAAIDEAEQVLYGTPRYDEAQQLISRLRQQAETIEDRPRLEQASALARRGDLNSLEAAIDEANQIGWGRALYEEARDRADTWRNQAHQLRVQAQETELRNLTGQNSVTSPNLPEPLPPTSPISTPLVFPSSSPLLPVIATPSNSNRPSPLPPSSTPSLSP